MPLRLTFFVLKHAHLSMRFIISNYADRGYLTRILIQALRLNWYSASREVED